MLVVDWFVPVQCLRHFHGPHEGQRPVARGARKLPPGNGTLTRVVGGGLLAIDAVVDEQLLRRLCDEQLVTAVVVLLARAVVEAAAAFRECLQDRDVGALPPADNGSVGDLLDLVDRLVAKTAGVGRGLDVADDEIGGGERDVFGFAERLFPLVELGVEVGRRPADIPSGRRPVIVLD